MSAIWGCIDLEGKAVETDINKRMGRCIQKYKIDEIREISDNNVYMACGLQFITRESQKEILPICSKDYYFTSDCIIDNREELIEQLECENDVPDGSVLFEAWKKWGDEFGQHVIGLFSFAVYDKKKRKFYLYTDHTASRCVHYCIKGKRIFFGTLTSSITDTIGKVQIDDQWMYESLAVDFSYCFLTEGSTPFKNIYIVPYGSGVEIDYNLNVRKIRYWNPLKKIRQKTVFDDKKCREEFRRVHLQCVKDAVRTCGEVGVLLSGGLDSTSVASVASKCLINENKKLYSFTSVPLKEYKDTITDKKSYYFDDESENVLKFCKHYPNIDPSFLECRGKSIWSYIEKWIDILEFPSKANVNSVWIEEAYKEAERKGIRVILSGYFGNTSISYGNIMTSWKRELLKGHFREFYRQFLIFTKKERFIKKKFLRLFLECLFEKADIKDSLFDNECVRREGMDKYKVKPKWKKMIRRYGSSIKSQTEYSNSLVSAPVFQMAGVYATKEGLYHGVVSRDPTMDKRMIELCLSLPYQSFAWNGVERRLVRSYLNDCVPDELRMMTKHRGRQSGDAAMRLDMFGFENGVEPYDNVSDKLNEYFYLDKAKESLREKTDDYNIDHKAKILAYSFFLKKYK
ncbi:asparagine synthase-related protein [Lachnospiraceae bacterium C1.1]|nr:asparagine synthase-related protein [Lachnospiraceae bacterium C1.1]